MIALAALSGPLPKLGVIAVACLAGVVLLAREEVPRAWATLGALVLSPVLLLVEIWRSPQLAVVHRHPGPAAAAAAAALIVLGAAAVVLARRPRLLAPAAMLALPFRIPISAGGGTANLLVPLYFVVAAGSLAWLVPVLRGSRSPPGGGSAVAAPGPGGRRPYRFEQLLAAFVVLYAIQAVYSVDFQKALQNMVFFYVPFALLMRLIRELDWDRVLLGRSLAVSAGLAVIFACIGFVEYETKTLLLNPKLIAANAVHPYFTVNSVFFDPDIFGRYLALVMIFLAAALLSARRPRPVIGVSVVLAILWGGLVLTLSRSSLGALLLGLAVLAALRWKVWPVVGALSAVIVAGLVALAITPRTFGLNQGLNGASSGRAGLIRGGLRMFGERPGWGYGSGGFVTQYQREHPGSAATVSASHTIPVTVAAEQGLIGLLAYLALVIAAVLTLMRGVRGDPVRIAVGAAFLALLFHTLLYADFLEDPVTWTLLGIGASLALAHRERQRLAEAAARQQRRAAAHA